MVGKYRVVFREGFPHLYLSRLELFLILSIPHDEAVNGGCLYLVVLKLGTGRATILMFDRNRN